MMIIFPTSLLCFDVNAKIDGLYFCFGSFSLNGNQMSVFPHNIVEFISQVMSFLLYRDVCARVNAFLGLP